MIAPPPTAEQNRLGWAALLAITGLAAWLRFHHLDIKPLHFDEGVNGWKILHLLDTGEYLYRPQKHHGPLLFYANAAGVALGGATIGALRFVPALVGTLAVPALLLFRRSLGWTGVCLAAFAVAVAPIEVYFSRTAIHEIYLFFFQLVLVGAMASWGFDPRRWKLVLAAGSLALMFATKETTVLSVAAMLPALVVALWAGREEVGGGNRPVVAQSPAARWPAVRRTMVVFRDDPVGIWVAGGVGLAIWAALFSSFGTHPNGVVDFFAAFVRWGETGTAERGHDKVWSYFWTQILLPYDRPLLTLGGIGLVWGGVRRDRLAIFSAMWFALSAALYSAIPYKTPWCVLAFSGPLFLGVGCLGKYVRDWLSGALRWGILALAVAMLTAWGAPLGVGNSLTRWIAPRGDSWTINQAEYDVVAHPFIYAQTLREYDDLVSDVRGLLATSPDGPPRANFVAVHYPLRYYLYAPSSTRPPDTAWVQDFEDGILPPEALDLLVVQTDDVARVEAAFGEDFVRRRYQQRPDHSIDVFVRETAWDQFVAAAASGVVAAPSDRQGLQTYSDEKAREIEAAPALGTR